MAIEDFKKLVDEYYCAVADYWDPRTADRRDWPHRRDAAKALYAYAETLERERDGALAREENTVAICNSERKAVEAVAAVRIRAARALFDLGHLQPEHMDGCPMDEPCDCPEYVLVGALLNDEVRSVEEVEVAIAAADDVADVE